MKLQRLLTLTILLLALVALVLGKLKTSAPLCKDCNVIVVSLDTLSANHLPCYGYARDTAPNLCAFAKKNILFSHAYANGTWTLPSAVSMFTGLNPNIHGVTNAVTDSLSKTIPFLPELLQKNGYTTWFYMPKKVPGLPVNTVYNRGIDKIYYQDTDSWVEALQDFADSVDRNKKTFLFLHTPELHDPYLIGNEPKLYTTDSYPAIPLTEEDYDATSVAFYQKLYKEIQNTMETEDSPSAVAIYKEAMNIIVRDKFNPFLLDESLLYNDKYNDYMSGLMDNIKYNNNFDVHNPRDVAYLRALYDQRIHQVDQNKVTKVLQFLSSHERVRKSTVVVIVSEHGEEFMEHGALHHVNVYDTNLHIPLIFSIPGMKDPKQIPTPVQLTDLTPTILDILGIPKKYDFQGDSLTGVLGGGTLPDRLLVTDGRWSNSLAIRNAQWKLHVKRGTNSTFTPYELYDIQKDPGELHNVLFSHLDVADRLIARYQPYELEWEKKILPILNPPRRP